MSSISALNLLQSMPNTTQPRAMATTPGTSTPPTNSSSTSMGSVNSLGSTFLNLLVQELQNQDPTAPMDSTQMVGQMISLNQLDQLASINQTLTNQFPTAAGTTPATPATPGVLPSQNGAGAQAAQQNTAAAIQAALQSLNASTASTTSSLPPAGLPNF